MFIKRKRKKREDGGREGGKRRGDGEGELCPATFTSQKCAASLLNRSDVLWDTWYLGAGVGQGHVSGGLT